MGLNDGWSVALVVALSTAAPPASDPHEAALVRAWNQLQAGVERGEALVNARRDTVFLPSDSLEFGGFAGSRPIGHGEREAFVLADGSRFVVDSATADGEHVLSDGRRVRISTMGPGARNLTMDLTPRARRLRFSVRSGANVGVLVLKESGTPELSSSRVESLYAATVAPARYPRRILPAESMAAFVVPREWFQGAEVAFDPGCTSRYRVVWLAHEDRAGSHPRLIGSASVDLKTGMVGRMMDPAR